MRPAARVLVLLSLLTVLCPLASAEYVERVIDGDTVVLRGGERVRLIGIDAPEITNPRYGKVGEFFGEDSRRWLRDLIEHQEIRLEGGAEPRDKYDRRLAYVFLGDLFVNRELVRRGYAETFRRFDFEYKQEFLALETLARSESIGMWNRPERPVHPEAGSLPLKWLVVLGLGGLFVFLMTRKK